MVVVAMYCRTNLTMRQLASLLGTSPAAVGRISDRHGPLLALAPARRKPGRREVVIVDGTLVPKTVTGRWPPSRKLLVLGEPAGAD